MTHKSCFAYETIFKCLNRFFKEMNIPIGPRDRILSQEAYYNYIWEKKIVDEINKYQEENNERNIEEIKNIFKGYPINLKNFAFFIAYNARQLNECNTRKKENISMGDSTESMESNIILK